MNAHTRFVSNFEAFGDLSTKRRAGAPDVAAKIAHLAKNTGAGPARERKPTRSWRLGRSVISHDPPSGNKIVPVGYSALSPAEHIRFGELLKDVIMQEDKRIALIASGDLSHCITGNAPGGYRPAGKQFDEAFIEHLEAKNVSGLAAMDTALVTEAEECGYRSTLIALGVMKNMQYAFKKYSYECPFGVGYLVAQFSF